MMPPVRSIPVDYEAEPAASEVHREWPEFADVPLFPRAGFWLTFLGGALITVAAIALSMCVLA